MCVFEGVRLQKISHGQLNPPEANVKEFYVTLFIFYLQFRNNRINGFNQYMMKLLICLKNFLNPMILTSLMNYLMNLTNCLCFSSSSMNLSLKSFLSLVLVYHFLLSDVCFPLRVGLRKFSADLFPRLYRFDFFYSL